MITDINLLSQRKKQKRDFGKILVGLYVVFGALFVSAVGMLIYSFSLNAEANALDREQLALENQISSYGEVRENVLVLNERLTSIQKVLNSRSEMGQKIAEVLNLIPPNFSVGSIEAQDDAIRVRVASSSLSEFNAFLEEDLPRYTSRDNINAQLIEMGSFAQTDAGYSMTLDFYFSKKAIDRK